MAYDPELADRVRELIAPERGADEKPMFGGLAFLINGNMSVAVSRDGGLMVRVPSEECAGLLAEPHVEPMVMAGRQSRTWVRVVPDGLATTGQLSGWVRRGVDLAKNLPPK